MSDRLNGPLHLHLRDVITAAYSLGSQKSRYILPRLPQAIEGDKTFGAFRWTPELLYECPSIVEYLLDPHVITTSDSDFVMEGGKEGPADGLKLAVD